MIKENKQPTDCDAHLVQTWEWKCLEGNEGGISGWMSGSIPKQDYKSL